MNPDNGYLLLVEDEPAVQLNNKQILQRRGYVIKQAFTLAEAREIIAQEPPKGIILDVNLPDGSGLGLLNELRKESNIPVLILSTLAEVEDIINGFEMGSDDYMTKPYDLSVFLMRVEALMRRAVTIPETLELGPIKLFTSSAIATIDGEDMLLSQKEYSILQLFVQNPDKILSADFIYEKVWGQEMLDNDNSLKVATAKLRKKLANTDYTVTSSRGEGYYLEKTGA